MAREREPAVRFSWEETWLSLINILYCGVFLGFLFDPSVAWSHTADSAQILLILGIKDVLMWLRIFTFFSPFYTFLMTTGHSEFRK